MHVYRPFQGRAMLTIGVVRDTVDADSPGAAYPEWRRDRPDDATTTTSFFFKAGRCELRSERYFLVKQEPLRR